MRLRIVVQSMLLCWAAAAAANGRMPPHQPPPPEHRPPPHEVPPPYHHPQVSVGISVPGISIGFNLPAYPQLVPVPGYPVYYAPGIDWNYFFYDGMYWLYQDDNWYVSAWYNGPWDLVDPMAVPVYVLRIPVRYYRRPPVYFRGWRPDAPPRWDQHWGRDWEQRRGGWDRPDRNPPPPPAPLPVYQRHYQGDRYPRPDQQYMLRNQNYRYEPHEPVVREHYQQMGPKQPPMPPQRGGPGGPPDRDHR
jgi:hypothetical protein